MPPRGRLSQLDLAVKGFSRAAEAYDRGRPEYPTSAVRWLGRRIGLSKGKTVVELAAGTGKFTRAIRTTGATVVPIEPSREMRRVFEKRIPDLPVLDGTAESIPLPDGFADVVVVGQAFHWFQPRRALKEIARVLRLGGAVGLVWNVRDESTAWVRELTRILEPYGREARRYRNRRWKTVFERNPEFTRLRTRTFRFHAIVDVSIVIDRVLSISFVALRTASVRRSIARRVRAALERDPKTRGRARVKFPYRTDVYWSRRRRSPVR